MRSRWWLPSVAAFASLIAFLPLLLKGTPHAENYGTSVFSTIAFGRNLLAGVDPFFVPSYGFGIPLPNANWFIKFPLAVLAAIVGPRTLYAALWLCGDFIFAYAFLGLSMLLTGRRGLSVALLATALLSFSNLATTYMNDWPSHFVGWALFPACVWSIVRTMTSSTTRERVKAASVCAVVLSIFTGSTHQNEIVTFYSGMGITLLFLLPTRWRGVLAVGCAAVVALCSAADVLVPTAAGMLGGNANPLVKPLTFVSDDEAGLKTYLTFLEPFPSIAQFGKLEGVLAYKYRGGPFFGLAALLLAAIGAVRPFTSRAPIGDLPNDIARMFGVAFGVFTALTLLPSWVMLRLPIMYMYRDGQAVMGLLCAASALAWLWIRLPPTLLRFALACHLMQMATVAGPMVRYAMRQPAERLFAYASEDHVLFNGLRRAGVGPDSRVALAGGIEDAITRGMKGAGITWFTDFALEGLPLVNASYDGGLTPMLGPATREGRYGIYETWISWKGGLAHLQPSGFDVLGITHVVAFEDDVDVFALTQRLTPVGLIELPGHPRVTVLRNDRAWSRAVLLNRSETLALATRADCPTSTIWCRDFDAFSDRLLMRLDVASHGASTEITLPAGHPAGRLLLTETAGRWPTATVDGRPRRIDLLLDTFPTVAIEPGDRIVHLSVRRTERMLLSAIGVALIVASLTVALIR